MQNHQEIYNQPDEIDLFELVENLVKEKFIIIIATFIGGVLAAFVALTQPQIYSSETVLNMAPMSNFAKINAIAPLVRSDVIDNEQVYLDYQRKLTSFDTLQHAFKQTKTAQRLDSEPTSSLNPALLSALNEFENSYNISSENQKESLGRITLRITSTNPNEPEYLINNVVLPYAQEHVTELLHAHFQSLINQEITNIANQIKVAQLERLMQIDTNFENLHPITVERRAEVALSPDQSKKNLTITLGIILGGMLGVFAALIRIALRSRKEKTVALAGH